MRVTFVLDGGFNLSGGDRVISTYASRLQERGHDICVVARPRRPYTLRDRLRYLKRSGRLPPKLNSIPSHFDGSPVDHRRLDEFRPVLDRDVPDADVVVATWWETAAWVDALAPSKGAKAFFIQHYEAFEPAQKAGVDNAWSLSLHKITISSWLRDLARDRFGDGDVSMVHNSVDTEQFFAPTRTKQPIPTIGFLDHNLSWKGVEVSLEAIRRLQVSIPRLRLVTFGTMPFDKVLPDGVEHVHWTRPDQSLIREIYGQCDVWLCGSMSEGFHLPPLEAMACRCPVVSTRVGGPIDIVRDGSNGYLAPVNDPAELARHLLNVLGASDSEWRAMSDAAYLTATEYTLDDATRLFEEGLIHAVSRTARHLA